ncbi:hypothetical protein CK203_003183 [Vitis vinifera]|uniref:Uncharacterized protein n=1 Tax=Vitis vinifera TaxID=29760 RepID=A0A438K6X3_VITVI|nr:hypothetical protein CK203_003183 [Vitis vinifera]
MEEEGATTPFWMPASSGHRRRRSSRSPSSIFLSSGFLIIFLPLTALLFIVFVLPPILSFTSYIFKPNMVKKSWDSLNLVLVLFAIICGFLSRGGGGGSSDMESSVSEVPEESTQRSNHGIVMRRGSVDMVE